ncbi:MAG TPA: helix-turn-helix domain-containing protein [Solirubrobacterales bacterium]|nr:helix-turn-helix domain-containing protein [Solirubrobacterales bacterium]
MIQSAATLFRERGVEGTAFADVLEHSAAPRGSVYHHFPGGKQQLAEEATRWAGEAMGAGIAAALREEDPLAALDDFVGLWRAVLEESDFRAGCPIVAAALAGERSPGARAAAAAAFAEWRATLAGAFAEAGLAAAQAGPLATLFIAAIEGGIVLARAQRGIEPLTEVVDELRAVARSALA